VTVTSDDKGLAGHTGRLDVIGDRSSLRGIGSPSICRRTQRTPDGGDNQTDSLTSRRSRSDLVLYPLHLRRREDGAWSLSDVSPISSIVGHDEAKTATDETVVDSVTSGS
jgi:hypothetical protein